MINRRGAALFIILISIIYFIAGMILYQFLKPDIDLARTGLECAAPDTAGDMVNCLIVDGIVPAVVIGILSTAGGYLTDKTIK